MTVGDADTLWHLQFFRAVTFESQRSTDDTPTVHSSRGRIGKIREPSLSFSEESRAHCVGHGGPRRSVPLRGNEGYLSSVRYCWRGDWQNRPTPSGSHDLSSVSMTVDDPDTPWYPQFFRAVISSPSTTLYSSRCNSFWLHTASGRTTGITMQSGDDVSHRALI